MIRLMATFFVLVVAGAGCEMPADPWQGSLIGGGPAPDSAFLDLAFGVSVDAIRRYEGDSIRYALAGFYTSEDTERARQAFATLAHTTDLDIAPSRDSQQNSDVNFLIYWFPEDEFARLMPNQPPYYVQLRWHEDFSLDDTVVFVRSDAHITARTDHLLSQLARGLGLRGPADRMPPESVLREGGSSTEYAEADLRVVEMLYSDEIHAGMTEAEVLEAF